MKQLLKKICIWFAAVLTALCLIWFCGRYCWKLMGFRYTQSAVIYNITVEADQVCISGCYPGSFPCGFIGYVSRQEGSRLYVGYRFSSLFGIFETGSFDVTIPTSGTVSEIYTRTADNTFPVWSGN